ncbi:hypothetical protein SDC9_168618 [bioreactor metagenome]|uniref:Uncharacterized protein n=1 Tax=bioreactor metagenome TaxID=1076179 RepID=A0A645G609_9ZZZZ
MPSQRIFQTTDNVAVECIADHAPVILRFTTLAAAIKCSHKKTLGDKAQFLSPIVGITRIAVEH